MKKILLTLLTSSTLFLAACATNTPTQPDDQNMNHTNLQHGNFVLTNFNGKTITPPNQARTPNISFGEDMRITGKICNNFNGQATVGNNILKAKAASTKMLCTDNTLNQAENALFKALDNGANVELSGKKMTLKGGGNTFVFERRDYM